MDPVERPLPPCDHAPHACRPHRDRPRADERGPLIRFVALSLLLHVARRRDVRQPNPGQRPAGDGAAGALDVTLRRLSPEPGAGFTLAPAWIRRRRSSLLPPPGRSPAAATPGAPQAPAAPAGIHRPRPMARRPRLARRDGDSRRGTFPAADTRCTFLATGSRRSICRRTAGLSRRCPVTTAMRRRRSTSRCAGAQGPAAASERRRRNASCRRNARRSRRSSPRGARSRSPPRSLPRRKPIERTNPAKTPPPDLAPHECRCRHRSSASRRRRSTGVLPPIELRRPRDRALAPATDRCPHRAGPGRSSASPRQRSPEPLRRSRCRARADRAHRAGDDQAGAARPIEPGPRADRAHRAAATRPAAGAAQPPREHGAAGARAPFAPRERPATAPPAARHASRSEASAACRAPHPRQRRGPPPAREAPARSGSSPAQRSPGPQRHPGRRGGSLQTAWRCRRPVRQPGGAPRIDLDATRRRARESPAKHRARAGCCPWCRHRLRTARASQSADAIAKAAKPDCRTAYAELGLLAIPPLVVSTVGNGGCRW